MRKMNLRYLVYPLTFSLLLWPSVTTQRCDSEVPEDALLEASFLPADNRTVYPTAHLPGLLANESNAVQEAIKAAQAETLETISDVISLTDFYYDVCPTYRFLLSYKWWYFFYNNQQLKCFAIHPVYITWCKTQYCSLSNNVFYWWNRCVQQWRYQYLWAVCVDQKGIWAVHYLKRKLPACCSCQRYWRYTPDQCQVN
ncbi:hypothetical protein ACJMK2_009762 [Sinanodonta woodiana]|uniref:Uncharacterized protein n=1 Tax=Sinanodonta woodiana TaxID=1069815 RepID=A0ABD3VEU7_SINWO